MNTYDDVPYPSYVHDQTHPDRLATIATLLGMKPAPVARCRLLELGCGDASNLIPMAFGLPESEFVGIDLAAQPVQKGAAAVRALGLNNLSLHQASVTDLKAELGRFDYIIAHGLYSWVPAIVQESILAICQSHLRPQGVAFISYNALPGGRVRQMLRDMLLFHVRGFDQPRQRTQQAAALMRFLAESMPGQDTYRMMLREEVERTLELGDAQLFHDQLAEFNEALYFTDFAARAARQGLQYLGEADYPEMQTQVLSEEVTRTLAGLGANRIAREQYLDFIKCRRFRQTLLCHENVPLQTPPSADLVTKFYLSCSARPDRANPDLAAGSVERFTGPKGGAVATDLPLGKAALSVLGECFPDLLSFDTLLARAGSRLGRNSPAPPEDCEEQRALREILLQAHASGLVEFHLHRPQLTVEVTERPTASALARWQLGRGHVATNLRHMHVEIADEIGRQLLLRLDGTRDHSQLLREMDEWLQDLAASKPSDTALAVQTANLRERLPSELSANLQNLARLALLTG